MCEGSSYVSEKLSTKPPRNIWRVSDNLRCYNLNAREYFVVLATDNQAIPKGAKQMSELPRDKFLKWVDGSYYESFDRPHKSLVQEV